jgi:hypothetical protein
MWTRQVMLVTLLFCQAGFFAPTAHRLRLAVWVRNAVPHGRVLGLEGSTTCALALHVQPKLAVLRLLFARDTFYAPGTWLFSLSYTHRRACI